MKYCDISLTILKDNVHYLCKTDVKKRFRKYLISGGINVLAPILKKKYFSDTISMVTFLDDNQIFHVWLLETLESFP